MSEQSDAGGRDQPVTAGFSLVRYKHGKGTATLQEMDISCSAEQQAVL